MQVKIPSEELISWGLSSPGKAPLSHWGSFSTIPIPLEEPLVLHKRKVRATLCWGYVGMKRATCEQWIFWLNTKVIYLFSWGQQNAETKCPQCLWHLHPLRYWALDVQRSSRCISGNLFHNSTWWLTAKKVSEHGDHVGFTSNTSQNDGTLLLLDIFYFYL